jgi:hypothetical protein
MNETWIGTIALIGMLITAIGCYLYMLGGRSGKWKRRFIGSIICSTAIWVESLLLGVFNFWQLLAYPLLIATFCLGYGSDILFTKIVKRFIVVLGSLTVGVLMLLTVGGTSWMLLPLQLLIALGSVWLGVRNPIPAAAEEFFVCLLLTECNIMYPFASALIK